MPNHCMKRKRKRSYCARGEVTGLDYVVRQDGVVWSQRLSRKGSLRTAVSESRRKHGLRKLRRSCQNGVYTTVLKHGPRSLTHMRVWWWKNQHAK